VIGLHRASADEGLAASCQGIGCEVLEFAGLIAAEAEPSQVIAFDEQLWTAQHF